MSLTVDALIVLASLIASAFFAGAETALTAASRARMHALEMDGNQAASLVNRLILVRGRLIGAMLLGGRSSISPPRLSPPASCWPCPASMASSMRRRL